MIRRPLGDLVANDAPNLGHMLTTTRRFAQDLHTINLILLNQPGLLVKVLLVLQHHNVNIEHLRVDPFDGTSRSRVLIIISVESLDRLQLVHRKVAKLIGVHRAETIPSRIEEDSGYLQETRIHSEQPSKDDC